MMYDVAVIGCGPVGALAANLLGKAGLRTIVLERETESYPLPRAVHLDHEMMRLFADTGLLPTIEPLMLAADGHIHIGADGGMIRFLSAAGRPRPFFFANDYFFYQPELEQALRAGLDRFSQVTLRLGETAESLVQDGNSVAIGLKSGELVRARYVMGCDGARSAVRRAIGVELEDLNFEEPWLVVDAEVDGPIRFPPFGGVPPQADLQRLSVMLCDPKRPATIVPGRGNHRRWEFMLLPGEDDQAMMAPDKVIELVAPWVEGASYRIVRAATYRFHGLVARDWQVGRVFLAGDAAHQTPPFFGQGMCHGMRDAANLVWKLALVLDGRAEPALLATYQLERDPHVRSVIGAAVDAGRYICELDPGLAAERDARLRTATGPRTAADLIPPIIAGVVAPGGGERAVQPAVALPDGSCVPLDAATGGGWAILARETIALNSVAADIWRCLRGKTIVIGRDVEDRESHFAAWLDRHAAVAAIVRPDFYTFSFPPNPSALSASLVQLGEVAQLRRQAMVA
jgi:3-(3-hydroxy-phenyl)propionate hydroxylase